MLSSSLTSVFSLILYTIVVFSDSADSRMIHKWSFQSTDQCKLTIEPPQASRTKREEHVSFSDATCDTIEESYRGSYPHHKFGGNRGPIKEFGRKYVQRNEHSRSIPTAVYAEITSDELRDCTRTNFNGKYWDDRMTDVLYSRQNDEKGHILASQLCGPAEWYNLFPQARGMNRNVGRKGRFGWYDMENTIAEWLRKGCGKIKLSFFLNYNTPSDSRAKGVKVCYEAYMGDEQVGKGDDYFSNM